MGKKYPEPEPALKLRCHNQGHNTSATTQSSRRNRKKTNELEGKNEQEYQYDSIEMKHLVREKTKRVDTCNNIRKGEDVDKAKSQIPNDNDMPDSHEGGNPYCHHRLYSGGYVCT